MDLFVLEKWVERKVDSWRLECQLDLLRELYEEAQGVETRCLRALDAAATVEIADGLKARYSHAVQVRQKLESRVLHKRQELQMAELRVEEIEKLAAMPNVRVVPE